MKNSRWNFLKWISFMKKTNDVISNVNNNQNSPNNTDTDLNENLTSDFESFVSHKFLEFSKTMNKCSSAVSKIQSEMIFEKTNPMNSLEKLQEKANKLKEVVNESSHDIINILNELTNKLADLSNVNGAYKGFILGLTKLVVDVSRNATKDSEDKERSSTDSDKFKNYIWTSYQEQLKDATDYIMKYHEKNKEDDDFIKVFNDIADLTFDWFYEIDDIINEFVIIEKASFVNFKQAYEKIVCDYLCKTDSDGNLIIRFDLEIDENLLDENQKEIYNQIKDDSKLIINILTNKNVNINEDTNNLLDDDFNILEQTDTETDLDDKKDKLFENINSLISGLKDKEKTKSFIDNISEFKSAIEDVIKTSENEKNKLKLHEEIRQSLFEMEYSETLKYCNSLNLDTLDESTKELINNQVDSINKGLKDLSLNEDSEDIKEIDIQNKRLLAEMASKHKSRDFKLDRDKYLDKLNILRDDGIRIIIDKVSQKLDKMLAPNEFLKELEETKEIDVKKAISELGFKVDENMNVVSDKGVPIDWSKFETYECQLWSNLQVSPGANFIKAYLIEYGSLKSIDATKDLFANKDKPVEIRYFDQVLETLAKCNSIYELHKNSKVADNSSNEIIKKYGNEFDEMRNYLKYCFDNLAQTAQFLEVEKKICDKLADKTRTNYKEIRQEQYEDEKKTDPNLKKTKSKNKNKDNIFKKNVEKNAPGFFNNGMVKN